MKTIETDLVDGLPEELKGMRLLTQEQVAQLLNAGLTKTRQLVASGEIKSKKIGKLRRVPVEAVREYLESLTGGELASA